MSRNKQMRDRMGASGNIGEGYRLVRPGGRIKFDRFTHQDDKLVSFIGDLVFVVAEDPFYNPKVRVSTVDKKFICYAQNEYNQIREDRFRMGLEFPWQE